MRGTGGLGLVYTLPVLPLNNIMDQDQIPYWKDYKVTSLRILHIFQLFPSSQTNVQRGLIAAGLCAALFILIFIAQRFLEKRR